MASGGRMDVKFCPQCRCTTWHVDGVCEWIDTHRERVEPRRIIKELEITMRWEGLDGDAD